MKFYVDDEEVTLEELEEIFNNLTEEGWEVEVLKICKIEPDALYFNKTLFEW